MVILTATRTRFRCEARDDGETPTPAPVEKVLQLAVTMRNAGSLMWFKVIRNMSRSWGSVRGRDLRLIGDDTLL